MKCVARKGVLLGLTGLFLAGPLADGRELPQPGQRDAPPAFWRGVYLFGLQTPPTPAAQKRLLRTLRDSLYLNVVQVRTYGHDEREDLFLDNTMGLWILLQDQELAAASVDHEPEARVERHSDRVRVLRERPALLRYYLSDEPEEKHFLPYQKASKRLTEVATDAVDRPVTITTLAVGGEAITRFVELVRPPEVLIDPYFITNNIPHPSLKGRDHLAERVRILPWGNDTEGYGWYFGFLQQGINRAVQAHHRPAAEAVRNAGYPARLVIAPQLHGVLFASTGGYDRDTSRMNALYLRPPSPAEIALQFGLGLAYGAKGFLGYPYGFDAGDEQRDQIFPGLVSGNPSGIDHASNFDILFGKDSVWTGYAEKWESFRQQNRRLEGIGETLAALRWIGVKSWSMDESWNPRVTQTPGWQDDLVTAAEVVIAGDPYPHLPQLEIGRLSDRASEYIVVVNRRCGERDVATVSLSLPNGTAWAVRDLERPARVLNRTTGATFSDRLHPGQWRIYRLDPQ